MICPECKHDESAVVDSRPTQGGVIRRRRCCTRCETRWTTYEVAANSEEAAVNALAGLLDNAMNAVAEARRLVQKM